MGVPPQAPRPAVPGRAGPTAAAVAFTVRAPPPRSLGGRPAAPVALTVWTPFPGLTAGGPHRQQDLIKPVRALGNIFPKQICL